jgi:hypothetical protein
MKTTETTSTPEPRTNAMLSKALWVRPGIQKTFCSLFMNHFCFLITGMSTNELCRRYDRFSRSGVTESYWKQLSIPISSQSWSVEITARKVRTPGTKEISRTPWVPSRRMKSTRISSGCLQEGQSKLLNVRPG